MPKPCELNRQNCSWMVASTKPQAIMAEDLSVLTLTRLLIRPHDPVREDDGQIWLGQAMETG